MKILQILLTILFSSIVYAGDSNQFESVTVGFKVTKPADWQFATADEHLENIRNVQFDDAEFQQAVRKYATAPLVAIMKYREPHDGINPSFKVNLKPLGPLKGAEPKQILDLMLPQFQNVFEEFKVVEPPTNTEVSGLSAAYMRINYSLAIPDGRKFPIVSELWIVPRGDYFFTIGAGSQQDDKSGSRQVIQNIVNSVVLTK